VINDIHNDTVWCICNDFSFYATFVLIYCFSLIVFMIIKYQFSVMRKLTMYSHD